MNPGDRFRAWTHNRAKSPLCHTPNRCGLYVLEQNEQFADLAMVENESTDELRDELARIAEVTT